MAGKCLSEHCNENEIVGPHQRLISMASTKAFDTDILLDKKVSILVKTF